MALFDNLRRAVTGPPMQLRSPWAPYPSHLETLVWSDIFDRDVMPLTRAEALTVPTVARARRLIAGSIARMPVRVWRDDQDVTPLWLTRTDRGVHPWHRMIWTIDDLIFTGWSLWELERGAENEVLHAERIRPDRWEIDQDGRVKIDDQHVDADDVALIPGPDEGVLTFGAASIRHASKLIRAADRASDTPTPTVNLHQTNEYRLDSTERDDLIARWAAARRGENGGVAFTSAGIEAREMGAIDGHLLIEGRNAASVDVARTMGIPASMVDATGPKASLSYETADGKAQELIDYGLAPYMSAVTARLSLDDLIPRGHIVRFDADRIVGAVADQDVDEARDQLPPAITPAPDTDEDVEQ